MRAAAFLSCFATCALGSSLPGAEAERDFMVFSNTHGSSRGQVHQGGFWSKPGQPANVVLKTRGQASCNSYTKCGNPSNTPRARWSIPLVSTGSSPEGLEGPLTVSASNGKTFPIAAVGHWAWNGGTLFIHPSDDTNYDYAAGLADFRAKFPKGTTLSIRRAEPGAGATSTFPSGWDQLGGGGTEWADEEAGEAANTRVVQFRTGYFMASFDLGALDLGLFTLSRGAQQAQQLLAFLSSLHVPRPTDNALYHIDTASASSLALSVTVGGVSHACSGPGNTHTGSDGGGYPIRHVQNGKYHSHLHVVDIVCRSNAGQMVSNAFIQLELRVWPDVIDLTLEAKNTGSASAAFTPQIDLALNGQTFSVSGAAQQTSLVRLVLTLGADGLLTDTTAADESSFLTVKKPSDMGSGTVAGTFSGQTHLFTLPNKPSCPSGYHHVLNTDAAYNKTDEAGASCDRYVLKLDNTGAAAGSAPRVFRVLARRNKGAGITGVSALLSYLSPPPSPGSAVTDPQPNALSAVDMAGGGCGRHVQINKNWHTNPVRHKAYWQIFIVLLRVPAGESLSVELSLHQHQAHGSGGVGGEAVGQFALHQVSHAMLSLIGWGNNGLWEQVGVGSNGESITYEPDCQQRNTLVLDTRPQFGCTINGDVGGSCGVSWPALGWTENVGGSDFMKAWRPNGQMIQPRQVQSFNVANGPCATNNSFHGLVGEGLDLRRSVSTVKTDDYARHFHSFRVEASGAPTPVGRFHLYQLGGDGYNYIKADTGVPLVLHYGDGSGVQGSKNVAEKPALATRTPWTYDEASPESFGANAELPVWLSVTGGKAADHAGRPRVNRGIVVWHWQGSVGGVAQQVPHFRVLQRPENNNAIIELSLDGDVTELQTGDWIEGTLELLLPPARSEDTVVPNAGMKSMIEQAHTANQPYQPFLLSAQGNKIQVDMATGSLQSSYPLRVAAGTGGAKYDWEAVAADLTVSSATPTHSNLVPFTVSGLLPGLTGYRLMRTRGGVQSKLGGKADGNQLVRESDGLLAATYNIKLEQGDRLAFYCSGDCLPVSGGSGALTGDAEQVAAQASVGAIAGGATAAGVGLIFVVVLLLRRRGKAKALKGNKKIIRVSRMTTARTGRPPRRKVSVPVAKALPARKQSKVIKVVPSPKKTKN